MGTICICNCICPGYYFFGVFMMKKLIAAAVSVLLLLGAAGCAGKSAPAVSDGKLKVYASFYAMYDFSKKVGGDRADVVNLVPAGTEPHDWEPSTTDIAGLERADLLVYNGAGMESWADRVLASLSNKKLIAVKASEKVSLLNGSTDAAKADPHMWLAPEDAKLEMAAIRDAFEKADPAGKSYYEERYTQNAARFDALDQKYRKTFSGLTNKRVVVSHQMLGYVCQAYGLDQIPIEGLSADTEPDPKRMTEIIRTAKQYHVKYILFEDLVDPKVAQTIASQIGAQTLRFNPLEGLTEAEQSKGEEYFSVMEQNLKILQQALGS